MRWSWLPVFAALVSCRAACGLDELDGVGGGGAGGQGGQGGSSSSDAGGGGSGGAPCDGASDCVICADDFALGPDELADCLAITDDCLGASGPQCSGLTLDGAGNLALAPGSNAGFWNQWPALYVHTLQPVSGAFIARTTVKTARTASEEWPEEALQHAGIVVSTIASSSAANDWFKAEYGTLAEATQRGLRVVRFPANQQSALQQSGDGRVVGVTDSDAVDQPAFVEVAVCRTSGGGLWAFYDSGAGWSGVDLELQSNPPLYGDVYVGLSVSAAAAQPDLLAQFGFFEVVADPTLSDRNACRSWLVARP